MKEGGKEWGEGEVSKGRKERRKREVSKARKVGRDERRGDGEV